MGVRPVPIVDTTNSWSLSTFWEGPRTLNEKIIGVVLAALASLTSFFLLPKAAAGVLTGVLVVLCAAFCSANRLENSLTNASCALPRIEPLFNLRAPFSNSPSNAAPSTISRVHVNGHVQHVSEPGPRMVAGTGQVQGFSDRQRQERRDLVYWRYPNNGPVDSRPRALVNPRT